MQGLVKIFPALLIRTDSLLFQCMKASAKYYIPQDAAFLSFFLLAKFYKSKLSSSTTKDQDASLAYQQFLKQKGLDESSVNVNSSSGTWVVSLKNEY